MELSGKYVKESAIDHQIALVFPNDLNTYGTLFGGKVLELGDWLCAVVAKRHTGKVCVTLGIDSVRFLAPATIGDILILKAAINCAWNTSMEIGLKVFAQDYRKPEDLRHIFSAYFTFVALDETRKPTQIPPVIPESDHEKRRYQEAERRRQKRLHS